jgi:nucleoside phosphorylase/glycosyltransferase involved in cell wall biosynthesis
MTGEGEMPDEKKCLIFMMNRWLSASGGIQTVNRELACAMAREAPFIDCIALVAYATSEERQHAFTNGVSLIHGEDENDWTSALLSPELTKIQGRDVIGVIGHSYFSGHYAIMLRDRFFPRAMAIQFIHMSPLDTESVKEYKTEQYVQAREQKVKRELAIAERADLVMCVGPRLWAYCRDQLAARRAPPTVLQMNCGIKREKERSTPPIQPTLLCLGRTDSKSIKGLDIFAYAAGHIVKQWREHPSTKYRSEPQFFVRGAKEDSGDLEAWLVSLSEKAGASARIRVRPYTTNAAELVSDYLGASLFVMPSREEGFGLVACEALSLGVPILISESSGFADTLRLQARESGMSISECVVQHHGAAAEIGAAYARAALEVLVDQTRAETYAYNLRERMMELCSWTGAAVNLLKAIMDQPLARGAAALQQAERLDRISARLVFPGGDGQSLDELYPELKQPGIISSSLRQAIMVIVERGTNPTIPGRLGSLDVIVREVDGVQFTSIPQVRSGDSLTVGGRPIARVGALVSDPAGNVFWTTAAHAVTYDAEQSFLIETPSGRVEASLRFVEPQMDIACLQLSSQTDVFEEVFPVEPVLGDEVQILSGETVLRGVVTGINANGEFGGIRYGGLFEIQVASGAVRAGDSGSLVIDVANGRPMGTVVSVIRDPRSGYDTVYAVALERATRELGLRILNAPFRGIKVPHEDVLPINELPARVPTVGILGDTALTMSHLSRAIALRREVSGGTMYFTGLVGRRQVKIVAVGMEAAGNLGAAVAATKILRDVRPDYLFVVGIAGGVRGDQSCGDVVVSSEIVYYEPAKVLDDRTVPRARAVAVTPRWLSSLAAQSSQRLHSEFGALPQIRVGTIASGEKVIHGAAHLADVLGGWSALAIEMEGAGVAEAASQSESNVPVVVIRGIADIMGDLKASIDPAADRERAAGAAVKVALELATRLPLPEDSPADTLGAFTSVRRYVRQMNEGLKVDHSLAQLTFMYNLGQGHQESRTTYVRRRLIPLDQSASSPSSELPRVSDELFDRPDISMIIIGGPGSGKTSLCRFHALRDSQKLVSSEGVILPIYVQLARFSFGALPDSLLEMAGISVVDVRNHLPGNYVRFYLDGLDEVGSNSRRSELLDMIHRETNDNSRFKVIITSREKPLGLGQDIPGYAIQPLDDAEFTALANRWLGDATDLLRQLSQHYALKSLTASPLFATIVILVFRQTGSIPHSRSRLYEVFIDLLTSGFDLAKSVARNHMFSAALKLTVLRRLALRMQLLRQRTCAMNELHMAAREAFTKSLLASSEPQLIDECVNDGLISQLDDKRIAFSHLSFQEYLAAHNFVGDPTDKGRNRALGEYLRGDNWWLGTLQFYIELTSNRTEILQWVAMERDKLAKEHSGNANTIESQAAALLSFARKVF